VAGTTSGNIGRFYPAKFALTSPTITPTCVPPSGTPFSYFGQDGFTTEFTLTAMNALSTPTPTTNYAGDGSATSWAKLPLTTWSGFGFAASAWAPSQPAGASLTASTTNPTATGGNTWALGTTTVTAKHQIARPTAKAAPTTVSITTLPTDSDGVTLPAAGVLGNALLRYGQFRLFNAYGSVSPLFMRAETQYWTGLSWVKNVDDSCTTSTGATPQVAFPAVAGWTLTPSAMAAGAMSGGGLKLEKATSGAATIGATAPDWLKPNPTAQATLGIYGTKESRKTIHIRELY
jgi:hypothetical protein